MFEQEFQNLQDKIQEIIEPYQKICDSRLSTVFDDGSRLSRIVGYSLHAPGKRLRSVLHMLMVEALGCDLDKSIPGALSYEMAHTASLVHDDIIDNASMRRGKAPVCTEFGLDAAIVSGDALLIKAFAMIAELAKTDISRKDLLELISCTSRMGLRACQGQLLDTELSSKLQHITIKDYLRMITLKTASLIEGPCEGAAIIARRQNVRIEAAQFGRNLGIAFQILDDSKDLFSCESSTLKGRFTDLINNKPNIYIIWALKKTSPRQKQKLQSIMSGPAPCSADADHLFQILQQSKVIDLTFRLYQHYLKKAGHALSSFPDTTGKNRLQQILAAMSSWPGRS